MVLVPVVMMLVMTAVELEELLVLVELQAENDKGTITILTRQIITRKIRISQRGTS
jgi:hypothetical protein